MLPGCPPKLRKYMPEGKAAAEGEVKEEQMRQAPTTEMLQNFLSQMEKLEGKAGKAFFVSFFVWYMYVLGHSLRCLM